MLTALATFTVFAIGEANGQPSDPGTMEVAIDAPPSFDAAVRRLEEVDHERFAQVLNRAGLVLPSRVRVTLIPEDDPRARRTPGWIVGRAFGEQEIVIFPSRVSVYPYDSLESVVRHELVHLALSARARSRPLPRWFHEGVAVSIESGWGLSAQGRLLLATLRGPEITDVMRLFESDAQPDTQQAYLLAAALVADLRQRHGALLPGRIAARVGEGVRFAQAFEAETGEGPNEAAARAWVGYRRWAVWLPFLTGGGAVWAAILTLSVAAFSVRLWRSAQLRRAWKREDEEWPDLP